MRSAAIVGFCIIIAAAIIGQDIEQGSRYEPVALTGAGIWLLDRDAQTMRRCYLVDKIDGQDSRYGTPYDPSHLICYQR